MEKDSLKCQNRKAVVLFIIIGAFILTFTIVVYNYSMLDISAISVLSGSGLQPTIDTTAMSSSLKTQMDMFIFVMESYIDEITRLRNELFNKDIQVGPYEAGARKIINAYNNTRYFDEISIPRDITTISLATRYGDLANALHSVYYSYNSNDCEMLEDKSLYGQHYGNLAFGLSCVEGYQWVPHPLNHRMLQSTYLPVQNDLNGTSKINVTFMHVIQNAVVDTPGYVYVGKTQIIPDSCAICKSMSDHVPDTTPHFNEVLTIAQCWGYGFYHGTLENLPRLAPYIDFLKRNKRIKIHVAHPYHPYLRTLLGLKENRLVAGTVRAKVLYMPAGNPCGNSPFFTTQLLSLYLRQSISNKLDKESDVDDHPMNDAEDHPISNAIVLIKRSIYRGFTHHAEILSMLEEIGTRRGLEVVVYDDANIPGAMATGRLFGRAVVVVAPHGAGEANLIFARPGTHLIEALCYDESNQTNLCYRNMAAALGLKYYGLIHDIPCETTTADELRAIVENII